MDRTQFTREFNAYCAADGLLLSALIDIQYAHGSDKRKLTKLDREAIAKIKEAQALVQKLRDAAPRYRDSARNAA